MRTKKEIEEKLLIFEGWRDDRENPHYKSVSKTYGVMCETLSWVLEKQKMEV